MVAPGRRPTAHGLTPLLHIHCAGVAGNTALVASCIESHTLEVLAAGVNPAALQQTRACFSPWISPPPSPPPPPSKEPPGERFSAILMS